jgi:hypothetical protein
VQEAEVCQALAKYDRLNPIRSAIERSTDILAYQKRCDMFRSDGYQASATDLLPRTSPSKTTFAGEPAVP